jgi:hypothetical protein
VRGHVCIGVRDRRTGHWLAQHPAISRPLSQSVMDVEGRLRSLGLPSLGDFLEFDVEGCPLRTSPVLDIEEREALEPRQTQRSGPSPLSRHPHRSPRITR